MKWFRDNKQLTENGKLHPEWIKDLYPLVYLNSNERELLCNRTRVEKAANTQTLIELGSMDDRALFLLKGKVRLKAQDGHFHVVNAESEDAKRPVSHLIPHHYEVTTTSHCEYFWVDNSVLKNCLKRQSRGGGSVQELEINPEFFRHRICRQIYHDLMEDSFLMPCLPEVLERVCFIAGEQNDLTKLCNVIKSDPSISALVLKIINSPVYRQDEPCGSVEEAVELIGFDELMQLFNHNILHDLQNTYTAKIRKYMLAHWWHSAEVGAIAYALAEILGGYDPKRALILGLLHDVGMLPIYYYADKYPAFLRQELELGELIKRYHGDVGTLMFKFWNFPDDYVRVSIDADDWNYQGTGKTDYSELIMVAQLHSFIGKENEKQLLGISDAALPQVVDIPAYKKLGLQKLSPEKSVHILESARSKLKFLQVQWGIADEWNTREWHKVSVS